MRRAWVAFVFSIFLFPASSLFSEALPGILVKDARSMGLGGSFTALSTGYDSLFGNPAGIASGDGELALFDLSTWLYIKPTTANFSQLTTLASAPDLGAVAQAANMLVADNGFGGGFSWGFGYAGKGIGLGTYMAGDVVAAGADAMTAGIMSVATLNFPIGIGLPVQFGDLELSMGTWFRPFLRIDDDGSWLMGSILSALTSGDPAALNDTISSFPVRAGFGFAADLGFQLRWKALGLGLVLRDLGPEFKVHDTTFSAFFANTQASLSDAGTKVALDPTIAAGFAFTPVLVRHFIETGLFLEYRVPFSAFTNADASAWNFVHLGADLKLLSFLNLRAGLNQGYLCAGLGVDFWIIKLDAAFFSQELGDYPGQQGRSGVSFQASVRL